MSIIFRDPSSAPRPLGFKILCILSYIGSGFSAFAYFFLLFARGSMIDQINYNDVFKVWPEQVKEQTLSLLAASNFFYAFSALLFFASGFGVYLMWQYKKVGFHVYTIAQILIIVLPIFVFKLPASLSTIFWTAAFVACYASYLRIMNTISKPVNSPYVPFSPSFDIKIDDQPLEDKELDSEPEVKQELQAETKIEEVSDCENIQEISSEQEKKEDSLDK